VSASARPPRDWSFDTDRTLRLGDAQLDLGREALGVGQGLEVRDVRQLLGGMAGAIQLDDVHILEVGKFAVDRAGGLPAFEEDRLTFSECHAGRVGQAAALRQWREWVIDE
jgi:hypothetical protein